MRPYYVSRPVQLVWREKAPVGPSVPFEFANLWQVLFSIAVVTALQQNVASWQARSSGVCPFQWWYLRTRISVSCIEHLDCPTPHNWSSVDIRLSWATRAHARSTNSRIFHIKLQSECNPEHNLHLRRCLHEQKIIAHLNPIMPYAELVMTTLYDLQHTVSGLGHTDLTEHHIKVVLSSRRKDSHH